MSAPIPGSAARVDASGKVYPLGPKAQADQTITEADVQDPAKLTRLLGKLLADVALLRRRFAPRRIDFEDIVTGTSGAVITLQHNFNGRVRWWLVQWASLGNAAPILRENSSAITTNTLSLQSFVAGTATIRIEESG